MLSPRHFFFIFIGILICFLISPTPTNAQTLNPLKGVQWQMGQWYVSGAYNWTGMTQDLDLMAAAGISWVRFSFGNHTQTSCYPTGFYTRLADEFDVRGLHGLASIYIPSPTTTTASASELQAYTSWLQTMVACYHTRFTSWELWNEPNYHAFWNIDETTTDDAAYARSVGYYISYLQATYQTIKNIDPNATVVLGGLAQNWSLNLSDGRTIGTMSRWMTEFISQGGYQYLDDWGFHPYADYNPNQNYSYKSYTGCGAANIERLDEFKSYAWGSNIPAAYRQKPIWLTEVGFTSNPNKYPGNTKGSESTKADCLTQTWQYFQAEGTTLPIIWYDFSQDTLGSTSDPGYSLVPSNKSTNAYTLTPAYTAYQNLWPASPAPSGDLNHDGTIDIFDVNFLMNHLGPTTPGLDTDTDSDILDYLLFPTLW